VTATGTVVLELGVGFTDDEVTVSVDGEQVWRRPDVSTNYSIGIAEIIPLGPRVDASQIEVRVRNLVGSAPLPPPNGTARDGGEVRLRADLDPTGRELTVRPAPQEPLY
jgi:hypothetical protein